MQLTQRGCNWVPRGAKFPCMPKLGPLESTLDAAMQSNRMKAIARAFEKRWFHGAMLVIGLIYGFGGVVHVGNILGFGESPWLETPISWQLGDVFWGLLDFAALIGIVARSPIGVIAVGLAALSQVAIYGLAPQWFALNAQHAATLRGLVYFNAGVLVVLAVLVYAGGATSRR